MPKIFLSYRREDSIDVVGRIHDHLTARFGQQAVFMDVDSIPFGVDFRVFLNDCVRESDVMLAVVGDRWLQARDEDGKLRLGDPSDFVTIEIVAAMERGIPVIPLLVGRAAMPKPEDLPDALRQFAYRNAAEARSGRDFASHMSRLIRAIEDHSGSQRATRRSSRQRSTDERRESGIAQADQPMVEPPVVAEPTNLGFDGHIVFGMPQGWFNGLGCVGGVSLDYDVFVEPREGCTGKCVRLRRAGARKKGFGTLMQRCPVWDLVGKRIRVAAELRTENLDSWAGLWVRIDGPSGHLLFDNMHDRPVKGTTPWTVYEIYVTVPRGSRWLNFGVLLSSNGTLWTDNFDIAVVGGSRCHC